MWPAIIAAAGSIGASALSYWNQRRSERLQEDLANSAVRRRMADLRKAGINPILAAQGVGAGGVSVQPVRFENPLEQFPDNMATAQRVKNENQLVEEQREKLKADTNVAKKQLDIMDASLVSSRLNNALTVASTRLNSANADKAEVVNLIYKLVGNTLKKYLGAGEKDADVESAAKRLLKVFGVGSGESPAEALWDYLTGDEDSPAPEKVWTPESMKSHKEVPATFRDVRKERYQPKGMR